MKQSSINILMIAVIAVSGTYVLLKRNDTPVQVAPDLELPVFSGENVITTTYTEAGKPMYRIKAQQLDYFAADNNTEFSQPELLLFQDENQIEWQVDAQHATLTKSHTLTMEQDVTIRNLLPSVALNTITMDDLFITLRNSQFVTQGPVTLSGEHFSNQGLGLEGSFKDYQAKLLNDVKGEYETVKP